MAKTFLSGGLQVDGRIICDDSDIETQGPNRGLIERSPNGHRHMFVVDNSGVISTVEISASPEVDMAEREIRIAAKRAQNDKDKVDFNAAGQLQKKIDIMAEHLGLKDRE